MGYRLNEHGALEPIEEESPTEVDMEDAWFNRSTRKDLDTLRNYEQNLQRTGFTPEEIRKEVYNFKRSWYTCNNGPIEEAIEKYSQPRCQCGAIHTTFPNAHYDWCPILKG